MTYDDLCTRLRTNSWHRIERDDRLFDIFPGENREKGVELWEQQRDQDTLLLRIRLPYQAKNLRLYTLATAQLEYLLQYNTANQLQNFDETATGSTVSTLL